jgi:hypothetical protein
LTPPHRVSPDGSYISYLAPYESRLNVFVKRLDGGATTRVTGEIARDISARHTVHKSVAMLTGSRIRQEG